MQKIIKMKKTLLLSSMFLSTISFAQFNTGDKLVSGNVGLNFGSEKTTTNTVTNPSAKNSGFNFGISSSTFRSPLVLNTFGFYVSHSVNKTNLNNPMSQVINSNLSYGVSFSHTRLLPLTKGLYLNFPLSVRAGFYGIANEYGATIVTENRTKGFNLSAGINAGLMYRLNSRWLLNLSLPDIASVGFDRGVRENYVNGVLQANKTKGSSFGFSSGLSGRPLGDLSVGFSYLIPSRKK
jgi:hypothetical protein